jgi:hypothetical protein
MAWQGVADNATIAAGTNVRLVFDVSLLSFGVSEAAFRIYIPQNAPISIATVESFPLLLAGSKWKVEGPVTADVVAGQFRACIVNAIAVMRSAWLITGSISLDTIEIEETGIIPEIPVSTTISLVAFAILGLVAVWFVAKFT